MPRLNEHELLKECLEGNEKALKGLYYEFKDRLFGLCLRYANDRSDAQDILQEGFIRIYAGLHLYKGTSPLYYWMRRVMINSALEFLRKNKKFSASRQCIDDCHIDRIIEPVNVGKAEELLELIRQLPIDLRVVFNLHSIEGYKHREIAELLKINESASKARLMRARNILKQKLTNQIETL